MNAGRVVALVVAVLLLGAGGGYWYGQRGLHGGNAGSDGGAAGASEAKKERRILYYRNPMGLPDTSPVPKKDPMGMDYVPVYEGQDTAEPVPENQIAISTEKVQKLGVRSERASMQALSRDIEAVGRVEVDERRVYAIAPKFEGWVEKLYVNATGQAVAKGQPLFDAYSPELVSAQREYVLAHQGVDALKDGGADAQSGMRRLAESSLSRLRNWDISEEQITALSKSGEYKRTLTLRSPVAGIVLEKKAVQGMRFMPGESLFQIADLSSVWVIADVYERDIAAVANGAKAKVALAAYPGEELTGTVTYIYPTMKPETRTIPVRIEIANPRLRLKPSMYAQVQLSTSGGRSMVTVPASAVIDTGTRQIVLIRLAEGRFEPRDVRVGTRSGDRVEVLEGVRDGEDVVVAANFLIDAESNLKAAVSGMGHASTPDSAKANDPAAGSKGVSHVAEGKVIAIDPKTKSVSIEHGPIASLKWPGMTMDFQVANDALLGQLKPGASISAEFVERKPGEYVITKITPAGNAAGGTINVPKPHSGH